MKILVIGAGVLGSLLTHILVRGGKDVTLLARGKCLAELQNKGLVIRHFLQMRTTRDAIKLTDKFEQEDDYDIVFIVTRRSQLDDILPMISANHASRLYIILGNNLTAPQTRQEIMKDSKTAKSVLFSFQGSGGRRQNGKVISIHTGFSTNAGKLTLGSLDGDKSDYAIVARAFEKTNLKLEFNHNIDAWLKCHAAFILPICFAVYHTNGNLYKIARDKVYINKMIDCMDEAHQILTACGVPMEPPANYEFVHNQRSACYRYLIMFAITPLGRLAASDHAMNAKDEMLRLYQDFCVFKEKANIPSPAWDELSQIMRSIDSN